MEDAAALLASFSSHSAYRDTVFCPPNALDAGIKKMLPRPKQHQRLVGGYIETRGGGGGGGRLDGNPDAPALQEGFYQITFFKAAVSTSPH